MAVVTLSRCCYRIHSCCAIIAGLVTLLAAKAFGADAVAITDLKVPNLELAKQAQARGEKALDGGPCLHCCVVLPSPELRQLSHTGRAPARSRQTQWPSPAMTTLPSCHTITCAAGRRCRPADISAGEA